MPEQDPKIAELEARLDALVRTQIDFQKEVSHIRGELGRLRSKAKPSEASFYVPPERPEEPPRSTPPSVTEQTDIPRTPPPPPPQATMFEYEPAPKSEDFVSQFFSQHTEKARANLEKFIGENLISLIGIIVLVLGVGIGAKYAIDNNLISPLTRIVIGYIFGFGLVGLAIKLKRRYHKFSAVLISGGMAIMYFVTYFAYSAYALIPQLSAFALMAMFTAFAVAAALIYSRQVIAHIGLVGAYAVPFLLSTDSGNYLALFSYMAVINAGILAISIKKFWKPLFYTSSIVTWAIFGAWFATKYSPADHFALALVFLAVFFAIFYATKLTQRLLRDTEADDAENLVGALATGFIFYVFCAGINDVAPIGSQQYFVFFTYLAVASIAILVTSFRAYGRAFVYLVVPFAWFIYGIWFLDRYSPEAHFAVAATFAAVFFTIFYVSILVHRLVTDNVTLIEITGLVLANAFVFYGFGYSILNSNEVLANYLGLYTAANALLHLAVAHAVSKLRSDAIDVVQVLTILLLTFTSIAIPVQFDGNFVTMIWAVEAALLFWFGRARGVRLFEYFSYPVMVLATGSLFLDWSYLYANQAAAVSEADALKPIANGDFVTAVVFVVAFAFIYLTNRDESGEPAIDRDAVPIVGYLIAGLTTFVLYNMFRIEIGNYFHLEGVRATASGDVVVLGDIGVFNVIWQINYTLFFLTAMAVANLQKLRSHLLGFANYALGSFALVIFATVSMYLFYDLQVQYTGGWHPTHLVHVAIRYISYVFAAGLLFTLYKYSRDRMLTEHVDSQVMSILFEGTAYAFVFVAASCELVNLMGQFHIADATKLGLSILWGIYALALIVVGIAQDKKYLRIAAMVLLGVTLAKLFLYDIADLETIPKTILFVTLGITLLVVSFLYNKYKNVIFRPETVNEE